MVPERPFIACYVSNDLPHAITELDRRLQSGVKESQSKRAGEIMTEASCDLIESLFGDMIDALHAAEPQSPVFIESRKVIDQIKGTLQHYLGWITGFFGNERLAPVVTHFQHLLVTLDSPAGAQANLVFPVTPELAREGRAALTALQTGTAADAREGIETLIRFIEAGLQPLLFEPKRLLKFNFVVDKTLNGVISITTSLGFRSLRRLGEHLPQHLHKPLADHLAQFLKD